MLKNAKVLYGLLAAAGFLAAGTLGYSVIEHYTALDALYMTVITLTTVGFGEIHALSAEGRLFTIFLIMFGFGSMGFLAHAFTEVIIERASSQQFGKRNMRKKIMDLEGHVIICGFGRVGEAAVEHFEKAGVAVVVIESEESQVRLLQKNGYLFVQDDATREEALIEAGVKKASALLALLNADPENLFAVLTARELNPTLHIIARSEITSSDSRMLRAGADAIISPYASAGRRVADRVLSALSLKGSLEPAHLQQGGRPQWFSVSDNTDLIDQRVQEAEPKLGGTIIGIRRADRDILMPGAEELLKQGDELLYSELQPQTSHQQAVEETKGSLALIDDNPVITGLYARLFHRQGFDTCTAATGSDGIALIRTERPDAAIVDYHLPDMDGVEVCRQIRLDPECSEVKFFLFTGDEDFAIREEALKAGVDMVILKSPEAAELVEAVKEHMEKK